MRIPDPTDIAAAVGIGFQSVVGDASPEDKTVETVAAEQETQARTIFESVATTSVVSSADSVGPSILFSELFTVVDPDRP